MTYPAAVASAVGAAVAIGLATALQHSEARQAAPHSATDVRLLLLLARRRRWLLAGVLEVLGLVLQALALRLGPVTLVQPIMVAALPVAVLVSVPLGAAALTRRVLGGVLLCAVALAALGVVLPGEVTAAVVSARAAFVAGAVCVAAIVGLLALHRRGSSWALGAAAGVAIGASAVLIALTVRQVQNPLALLRTWPLYALAVVGLAGLLLSQAALQKQAIAAPLTALTVTEPVVAVALGVALLHERLPAGAATRAVAGGACVLVVLCVLVLAADADA